MQKVPNGLSCCHTRKRMGAANDTDFLDLKKKKNYLIYCIFHFGKVCVIPKEGWARPRVTILLLV